MRFSYPLAVFILNHLIQTERGPFGALQELNAALHQLHPEVAKAIDCHVCLSGYTSMMVVALAVLGGAKPRKSPLLWLATWGATLLLYEVRQLPSEIYLMALEVSKRK